MFLWTGLLDVDVHDYSKAWIALVLYEGSAAGVVLDFGL